MRVLSVVAWFRQPDFVTVQDADHFQRDGNRSARRECARTPYVELQRPERHRRYSWQPTVNELRPESVPQVSNLLNPQVEYQGRARLKCLVHLRR